MFLVFETINANYVRLLNKICFNNCITRLKMNTKILNSKLTG